MLSRSTRRRGARRERGFTLIELLVAVIAGLFVAIAAFALAKQGSRFFQSEARLANAQFAELVGFERLRADIARAGFLSTPNIQRDPNVCGRPGGTAPAFVQRLAALRIDQATPTAAQDATNGLSPDRIYLSGSYTSVEMFPVRTVTASGTGYDVYLGTNFGSMMRLTSGNVATASPTLTDLFKPGRLLRIVDTAGRIQFGVIKGYSVVGGAPVVSLTNAVPLQFTTSGSTGCGIAGFGTGSQANVVNWIMYELRDVQSAPPTGYAPLYAAEAGVPGDVGRLDLIRVELDETGAEMDGTLEIVAEFAVDLKFGMTYLTTTGVEPLIANAPVGDTTNIPTLAADIMKVPGSAGPERIRSLRVRLSVRSREGDRPANIAPGSTIFRYAIAGDGGFARVRTLTADVQLPNLAGASW